MSLRRRHGEAKTRWPARRIAGYLLAATATTVGLWLLRDHGIGHRIDFGLVSRLEQVDLFGSGRPAMLTGNDSRGRLEVPVVNLWQRPGFDRLNRVAARVPLPARGTVESRVTDQIEIDGVTWNEVRVGEVRGWVVGRFVAR